MSYEKNLDVILKSAVFVEGNRKLEVELRSYNGSKPKLVWTIYNNGHKSNSKRISLDDHRWIVSSTTDWGDA